MNVCNVRALELDPCATKAWMRRGIARHKRGKYLKAVQDFSEVLRLCPGNREATGLQEKSLAKYREVRWGACKVC
ncbi:unnamed protein product, partial [Choristocarpus tenellus]